jgi:hypothetical protein
MNLLCLKLPAYRDNKVAMIQGEPHLFIFNLFLKAISTSPLWAVITNFILFLNLSSVEQRHS